MSVDHDRLDNKIRMYGTEKLVDIERAENIFLFFKSAGDWVEFIDTEKKIYKWKYAGKDWDTRTDVLYMDNEVFKYKNSLGFMETYNFINFRTTYNEANGYIQNDCINETIAEEKEKIEIASMIDKAKDTCKSLGFNEGTEKFSDCALKLYSQSVELAAKQNQQIVMQPQSSGSNVMTIYDPVRDSNALMDKGMKMLTGRCTLGLNC
jgi:hypothetical protein